MKYVQYPVHNELKNLVRYFWSFDAAGDPAATLHIRSFADRFPRLIFQDMSQFEPIRQPDGTTMPVCYLSGLDTAHTEAFWTMAFSHFGVSFYPHALPVFFKVDAFELTNLMPDIQLLDKTELPYQLEQARDHQERVLITTKYLYDKLQKARHDLIINDVLHTNSIGTKSPFTDFTEQYKISERQFQRRFKNQVGISPKKFQRIIRFEKALDILTKSNYGQLTQVAYETGYVDQSHFIKDFSAFSGMSPYDFIKNRNLGSESSSFIYPEK